mgnify:CR=1 FL=1
MDNSPPSPHPESDADTVAICGSQGHGRDTAEGILRLEE